MNTIKLAAYQSFNPPKVAPDSKKLNQAAQNKNMNATNAMANEKPKIPKPPKI